MVRDVGTAVNVPTLPAPDPPPTPPSPNGTFYWLESSIETTGNSSTFLLKRNDSGSPETPLPVTALDPAADEVRIITVTVTVKGREDDREETWEDLGLHLKHRRALTRVFAEKPTNRATELFVPLIFKTGEGNGATLADVFEKQLSDSEAAIAVSLPNSEASGLDRRFQVSLTGGTDGQAPKGDEYDGDNGDTNGNGSGSKSGLKAFEDLEDISIVAAPGSTATALYANGDEDKAFSIQSALISHCERMKYRIAVLDSIDQHLVSDVRRYRGRFDSQHAALYYPWVCVLDPVTREEIKLPPSGFVAGIYARNDVEHGVHKAPANEVVRGAVGFVLFLNK